MGPEQIAVKSCDKCVRKAVCILYHGYTKLELQFGNPSPVDPQVVVGRIGEALAAKCGFYMESGNTMEQ